MVIIIINMNRQVNPTIAERMAVLEKTCSVYTWASTGNGPATPRTDPCAGPVCVWPWASGSKVQPLGHSDSCQGALRHRGQHHTTLWHMAPGVGSGIQRASPLPMCVQLSGLHWGLGRILGCWEVYRRHCSLVKRHFPRIPPTGTCHRDISIMEGARKANHAFGKGGVIEGSVWPTVNWGMSRRLRIRAF